MCQMRSVLNMAASSSKILTRELLVSTVVSSLPSLTSKGTMSSVLQLSGRSSLQMCKCSKSDKKLSAELREFQNGTLTMEAAINGLFGSVPWWTRLMGNLS